jgi:hypothetical protein
MDRRQFGLLSLGTAAATAAGVPVMLAPAGGGRRQLYHAVLRNCRPGCAA